MRALGAVFLTMAAFVWFFNAWLFQSPVSAGIACIFVWFSAVAWYEYLNDTLR